MTAILVVIVSAAQTPYSGDREYELGKLLASEVARQNRLVDDPVVIEFVQQLGQALARHSALSYPLQIRVIGSPEAKATALPGGFLFVSSGLIRGARSETELAALIAHQIAHIAARHGMRTASRENAPTAGAIPMILMGGWGGICIRFADGPFPLGFQAAARANEEEADRLGREYLEKEPPRADSRFDPIQRRLTPPPKTPKPPPSLRRAATPPPA
ncbi:MAG: M48 family metalloprotease [Acidobacteria bacterium]|nr:M48 family metalloprotease [Acidobacteriota bacterium]